MGFGALSKVYRILRRHLLKSRFLTALLGGVRVLHHPFGCIFDVSGRKNAYSKNAHLAVAQNDVIVHSLN